jgi:excisionase family DNA binding protein
MRIPKDLWAALDGAGMLSVPQAARLLNLDERTVRTACEKQQIPSTRVGVRWQIPTWWLRQQVRPPRQAA